MIDNVVLVITGTHHDRDAAELLEKCHPLGILATRCALVWHCPTPIWPFRAPNVHAAPPPRRATPRHAAPVQGAQRAAAQRAAAQRAR
eukprot:5720834-Prymnesium_polylepis.1